MVVSHSSVAPESTGRPREIHHSPSAGGFGGEIPGIPTKHQEPFSKQGFGQKENKHELKKSKRTKVEDRIRSQYQGSGGGVFAMPVGHDLRKTETLKHLQLASVSYTVKDWIFKNFRTWNMILLRQVIFCHLFTYDVKFGSPLRSSVWLRVFNQSFKPKSPIDPRWW